MTATLRPPPDGLAQRFERLTDNVPAGHVVGGPRLASAMLLFFGRQLERELDALQAPAVAAAAAPTRRPRR